jgi:hypothetical protein
MKKQKPRGYYDGLDELLREVPDGGGEACFAGLQRLTRSQLAKSHAFYFDELDELPENKPASSDFNRRHKRRPKMFKRFKRRSICERLAALRLCP